MKTPLNWISLYTDIDGILEEKGVTELAHLYSIHTAEIDAIEKFGQEDKVVVGKIISAAPHPDSDHLNVVQVDLGQIGKTQIVCGAHNVLEARYVAVATIGTMIKGEFEIKATKLRGQESNGMICSEDELDFQETRAEGIMKLEDHFDENALESNIGKPFFDLKIRILGKGREVYENKMKDIVFEIDNKFITNRPDLFSVEGNAREFGAIFDLPFDAYPSRYQFSSEKLNTKIETDKVLSYQLVKVQGVPAGESPFGIRYMLYKAGINPKFDLVDMTNYIMTELGQPMHAFDADKIVGGVTVRMAKEGEKMLALNGETYELNPKDIVIADDEKILAIGGIIGGQESAISETTKNIYIESACFDASTIRLTAQRLGVRTDSSTRYEKSQDPLLTYRALSRALDFLAFVGKEGKITADSEYLDKSSLKSVELRLTKSFLDKKIGIDFPEAEIERILKALGFEFNKEGDEYVVAAPSWRVTKDVAIKEDIAEEIGRIFGYHKVPETPVVGDLSIFKKNDSIALRQETQEYFSGKGWFEVYNYSFSNESLDEKTGLSDHGESIKVLNAYSNEFTLLRRNMIGNLLQNVSENKRLSDSFSLFEISKIEFKEGGAFCEKARIAGIGYSIDFNKFQSEMMGYLASVSANEEFNVSQGTDNSVYPYLHPNKSGEIFSKNGELLGAFGYLNPQVASNFDLEDSKLLYFDFDFELLLEISKKNEYVFNELPKFPGISRELNFLMDEKIPAIEIIKKIDSVDLRIKNIKVIDTYRNEEKLGKDKKSVTFSAYFLDYDKTITDEEALIIQNKIIDKLAKENIEIRK